MPGKCRRAGENEEERGRSEEIPLLHAPSINVELRDHPAIARTGEPDVHLEEFL